MRVLCAGAGGYIGLPLCRALKMAGHEVVAFDRFFFGKTPAGADLLVTGDTRSAAAHLKDVPGIDAVVDLAGLSNDATAEIDRALTYDINVVGAQSLARWAKEQGVKRYVYASSCSVYGHTVLRGVDENALPRPQSLYADSKVEVELLLREHGLNPVILRNATVFGVAPRMRFDLAVNIMTLRAYRDNMIYIMGGGEQWRPFIHIDDVVRAFVWAVETPDIDGETFNVGSDALNFTIGQVAQKVREAFPNAVTHNIPDDVDKRSYHVSFEKFAKAASFKFNTVEYGITEVGRALRKGEIDGNDPTCYTLQWYKSLMEWDRRLNALRIDGKVL